MPPRPVDSPPSAPQAAAGLSPDRVLITGGEGMIARAIPFGMKLTRRDCDVRDERAVQATVDARQPSAILHLAALDIRQAEADPAAAYATNVLGSYHLARAARAAGIPLVFLSSGAIFNGLPGARHHETALPDPVNIFGQTKLLAEHLVHQTLADALIIRTGWVFGGHQAHHRKFVDLALEKASRNEPLQATVDQWGSPTSVGDFVIELQRLLAEGVRGLRHVVNAGAANGVDIARVIVTTLGSRSEIIPVHAADLPNHGPRRPASEVLVSSFQRLPPWQEALRAYCVSRTERVPGVAAAGENGPHHFSVPW